MRIDKKIKTIFFSIALIYFILLSGLYVFQRGMIFFPDKTRPSLSAYDLENLDVQNLSVQTKDGLNVTGWIHRPSNKKPTFVFFHGNAGHYGHSIYAVADYIKLGYGVVLVGYRGYGGNEGSPSETGFYEDGRAYINHLIQEENIAETDIVLYGQSIGSGVAVQMATEFQSVKALILEAPYTSLPDVAARTYFFIPVHLLMKDKFNNLNKINEIKSPLFIMHGDQDKVIPFKFGKTLFERAEVKKDFMIVKNRGHNDMPDAVKSEGVLKFLESL